jgi:hypothetical protein
MQKTIIADEKPVEYFDNTGIRASEALAASKLVLSEHRRQS